MNDLGKIAVIAGIFGAILLAGILMTPIREEPTPAPVPEPVVVQETVTVLQEDTLEMLDPVYSEKAVYQDGILRISFDASYTDEGLQSRLPFWMHNVSGDVINVLWERCSLQLPGGNTVKIVNEESGVAFGGFGSTISIAPSGDLFDAIIPASELLWDDEGWSVTTGVLDDGPFTLVLAIEHGELRPCVTGPQPDVCSDGKEPMGKRVMMSDEGQDCASRCITYYTFRFIVR